jgi:hypothetical protein
VKENALPPHPAGVNELGLRVVAAVQNERLTWTDVARSLRLPVGELSQLFQGRAPEDGVSKLILETILDDCGG